MEKVIYLTMITKYGKGKWKLLPGIEEITKGQAHTNTWKLYWDISTGTAIFFNRKIEKTAVPVEISRYSFCVFVCAWLKKTAVLLKYLDTVSVCLCVPVLRWSLQFLVGVFTFLSLNLKIRSLCDLFGFGTSTCQNNN